MRDNLKGALWRLAVFSVICVAGVFAAFAVFAQLRFEDENVYQAIFSDVSGLKGGQFVRIAGVEVGKVKSIAMQPDATVKVAFSTDRSVVLTTGNRAVIRWDDLIGGRYLELSEGAGGTATLKPGATIPMSNTAPALDLDTLIGGFRPLFRALNPEQVNALTGQLITAFQGQGETIGSFLTQTAELTNTLADRDQLIGEVIVNLNTVLASLGKNSTQLDTTVTSLADIVSTLANHRSGITEAIANTDVAARSIADLLQQGRAPLQKVVRETDRTAGIVVADHEYMDNLLATLPNAYQKLQRLGMYGDYFSFYLCDAILKLNGKGGQPVYVKVAGQSSGRCAPK